MDLAALLAHLQTAGDPLTLDAADQRLPGPLRDFLTSVPGQRLTLTPGGSGLHLDGAVLTVSGAAVAGSGSATWPVAGMGDAVVTVSSIEVRCTADDQVSGVVDGQLPLNATVRAAVSITSLPAVAAVGGGTARGWRIGLASDVAGVTPVDLVLLGRGAAPFPIPEPAGLDALRRQLTVPSAHFGLTFYPGTDYAALSTFEVDVPGLAWSPVPGLFTLDQVGLAGTVSSIGWAMAVIGRFSIGTVPMELSVGLSNDTLCTATLRPVGATFPGLAALAAWAAGSGPAAERPTGVSTIGGNAAAVDAAISSATVRFDWQKRTLQEVQVVSLLTLGAMQLDVAFSYPEGTLAGSLHDGKPLPLADVLSSLGLPADALPTGAQITEADFSATPALGSYLAALSVDAELTAGPLTVKRLNFSIARSSSDGVTGQIGGTIKFGSGILVDLLAEYGGAATGWEFSGRTDPGARLHIGDVLADLAHEFGVTEVPDLLRQLVLTDLLMDYQTGTGAFTFTCTGGLSLVDTPVSASINVEIKPIAPSGHETKFSGHVTIGGVDLDLVLDTTDAGSRTFVASYTNTGDHTALSLHNLIAELSPHAAELVPGGLDIGLREIRLLYLAPAAGSRVYALGLVLSAAVDLSQLPLVGDRLPAGETLAVDGLQIFYCSETLTAAQLEQLGGLLPSGATPLPAGPLAPGVGITARLQAGSAKQDTALALPPAAPATVDTPPKPAAPAGYWLDVHRQLGVVQINRIGLLYQNGALLVGLDAAVTLGPLSLSLDGLCFGSPLSEFKPTFQLSGVGLAYASGPLTISGALLRVPDAQLAPGVAFQFDGTVQISAEQLELAAIGSYAEFADGRPSLFVFAQLETPLGGPPAFFVDGLMAGFGFNRALALPAPDEVTAFPLVALGAPAAPGAPAAAQNPGHVLDVLEGRAPITPGGTAKSWITPQPGAIWLAFGVEFSSFQLVRTRALLIADISEQFKLAVLGSSILRLPQAADSPQTYAYVELGIEAVLEPQEGYFGLTAILSRNSYVIAPECHLTGGFAVAAWFGDNPHAGEFVVTLGGYHPAFAVPGHFPQVPRLGFDWAVSDTIAISGAAYAALTTSCVMAGGRLAAVFHDGGLRAWFTVEADLLISWRPFFFTGHFAVSIGVSYSFSILGVQKTISVSVGASMDLWGPPTGGTVTVDLWIVSFTVAFGAKRTEKADAALTWPQFRDLLPPEQSRVVIQPTGQLQATLPPGSAGVAAQGGADAKVWMVRATGFAFSTQSALPASELRYGPAPAPTAPAPLKAMSLQAGATTPHDAASGPIDIKPMNLTAVTSVHRLTVRFGSATAPPYDIAGWKLTPRTSTVPDSLWGKPPAKFSQIPARPAAEVLADRYVGYDVQTPAPALGTSRGTVPAAALADDVIARATLPIGAGAQPGRYRPVVDQGSITEIAGIAGSAARRSLLYQQLRAATGFAGPDGPLDKLAASAGQLYSDAPMREG